MQITKPVKERMHCCERLLELGIHGCTLLGEWYEVDQIGNVTINEWRHLGLLNVGG